MVKRCFCRSQQRDVILELEWLQRWVILVGLVRFVQKNCRWWLWLFLLDIRRFRLSQRYLTFQLLVRLQVLMSRLVELYLKILLFRCFRKLFLFILYCTLFSLVMRLRRLYFSGVSRVLFLGFSKCKFLLRLQLYRQSGLSLMEIVCSWSLASYLQEQRVVLVQGFIFSFFFIIRFMLLYWTVIQYMRERKILYCIFFIRLYALKCLVWVMIVVVMIWLMLQQMILNFSNCFVLFEISLQRQRSMGSGVSLIIVCMLVIRKLLSQLQLKRVLIMFFSVKRKIWRSIRGLI